MLGYLRRAPPDERARPTAAARRRVLRRRLRLRLIQPTVVQRISPSAAETASPRAGDEIVAPADVVMNRAFTVDAAPEAVWPWLVQLGKQRAGWYLPRRIERLLPAARRAARHINPRWQDLRVGDVVPDYGGAHETFEVAQVRPPTCLVYRSRRGHTEVTWSITLEPVTGQREQTRVFLRLRLAPVRHKRLAETAGELFDLLTVAGMAAGLRERLAEQSHYS